MAAIAGFGPAIYGFTRGMEAGEAQRQRGEAFETEQAIRREQLSQEQEMRPIRRQALELSQEEQKLNLAISGMKKADQELISKELRETLQKRKRFGEGLSASLGSGDWSHFTKALTEIYPEVYKDAEATRNPDGTVSLAWGEGDKRITRTIRGRNKNPDTGVLEAVPEGYVGTDMTPDDEIGLMAPRILDPLAHFEDKMKQQYNLERIAATGEWRLAQEAVRSQRRVNEAEDRAARDRERAEAIERRAAISRDEAFFNRQRAQINPLLTQDFDKPLSSPLVRGYNQLGDTEFRTKFGSMIEAELDKAQEDGRRLTIHSAISNVKEAVKQSYNDVLNGFTTEGRKVPGAKDSAARLKPLGRLDFAKVQQEAAKGNGDAVRLRNAYLSLQTRYGTRMAEAMLRQAQETERSGVVRR